MHEETAKPRTKRGTPDDYDYADPVVAIFWKWALGQPIKIEAIAHDLGLGPRGIYHYVRKKGSIRPLHQPRIDLLRNMLDLAGYKIVIRKKHTK